ncbi:hypothetical protein SGGMMB4_01884 [Sodalis glossinidius str. 'morsitans']|uniref:Uncharacterized protein n=1 Tax=Sodalis glossinidius (strain morsitans) TaxID=343509 RepID=A0A193QHL2_SODGM|nr:hypothetical protein SGGMMB4_01884 [Sodalis glossinidius str. 'morsitans']
MSGQGDEMGHLSFITPVSFTLAVERHLAAMSPSHGAVKP